MAAVSVLVLEFHAYSMAYGCAMIPHYLGEPVVLATEALADWV